MMRKARLYLIVLTMLMLNGCRLMGLFHTQVTATPAPTALPLPTSTLRDTAVVQSQPSATVEPEPTAILSSTPAPATPELPTATSAPEAARPTPPPTRVVAPEGGVALPPGFGISVYAEGLRGPRMMTVGPGEHLYVAERGAGRIVRLPDRDGDGLADGVEVVAESLSAPSSLAFYRDGSLYVGETTRILRLWDPDGDGVFQEREVVIDGLPRGGHSTRTVLFSPDWEYLYVSIGSSCNNCVEENARRATIMRYRPDGSDGDVYASGLRNAVGITFRPGTEELWATNNGRDWMGDNQPPETVYVVDEGDDAGWPYCHAGRILDPDLGEAGDCEGVKEPVIEMQAHSAPLGLTFYTGQQFPAAYRGDLFIAFHGSWNRTVPTGYKVVRAPLEDGEPGPVQDFAAGWLRENGSKWGRPVDVHTGADGGLFISDDTEGFIYRVFYAGE